MRVAQVATSLVAFLLCSPLSASTIDEHIELIRAVESVGVEVIFNTKGKCVNVLIDGRYNGYYDGNNKELVVCQDNKTVWDGEIIEATPNDLDTIRHEAHHLVQDCVDGDINGQLNIFMTQEELTFSQELIDSVRNTYKDYGASEDVINLEIEAFAVANSVSPATIATVIKELCRNQLTP